MSKFKNFSVDSILWLEILIPLEMPNVLPSDMAV